MKQINLLGAIALWILFSGYNLMAQNPNWVLPASQFDLINTQMFSLPQTPFNPTTGLPEADADKAYQGEAGFYSSAGYTGPDGQLLLFTVDQGVYDKNGWKVGEMRAAPTSDIEDTRQGYSEILILPMGNSCEKFAIIFPSSAEDIYGTGQYSTSARQRIYMAVYDINAVSNFNGTGHSTGALIGEGSTGYDVTLKDISERDGIAHYDATALLYSYDEYGNQGNGSKGYKIAATELIENCFHYVFVNDQKNLIRYKLTNDDLEYDNYWYPLGFNNNFALRTEMEIIKLTGGRYRMAVPVKSALGADLEIKIFDLDGNMEVIPSSIQTISLGTLDIVGLEFDATGRYLYFTHETNGTWPNVIDVWDYSVNGLVSTTFPGTINAFKQSFIERYGSVLYLASNGAIGAITNASTGIPSFNSTLLSIPGGSYGNDANLGSTRFRHLLPDQVDDAPYGNFSEFSCDCCTNWSANAISHTANESDTWSPTENPFNGGTSATVTISNELRIPKGKTITIQNMIFRFGPDARVVIERGDETVSGGFLSLNGTTFTANFECAGEEFESCGIAHEDDCERRYWEGIIVEGYLGTNQVWNSTTKHGRVQIENNSKVEFARTAVMAGYTSNADYAGGIVRVTNSTIKDNIVGLRFMPFVQLNSSSVEIYTLNRISHNEFITTTDFITTSGETPNKSIWVAGNSGLYISGNLFENQATTLFAHVDRGTGVYSEDSRITISWLCSGGWALDCTDGTIIQNEFRNLAKGVDAFTWASTRQTRVEYSIFDNNIIGAQISGQSNPRILDNEFYIPRALNNVGLYLVGSTGYSVENNFFTHVSGSSYPWSFGIAIDASGAAVNEIYRNKFQNIRIGIVSQGVNANSSNLDLGLRYLCNNFIQNIRWSDIYLNSGSLSDDQGFCLPPDITSPAGNIFSHSSTIWSDHYDFRVNETNVSPSNLEIDYNYHTPDATPYQQRLIPLQYTGHIITEGDYVQPFMCNIYYSKESCPVKRSSFNTPVEVGPKSNDQFADLTVEAIYTAGTQFEDEIDQHLSILDGGNTLALLNAIENNESVESISAMLSQAGEMISKTVLQAMKYSGNSEYEMIAGLSMSSVLGLDGVSDGLTYSEITLPSEDVEVAWKIANIEKENFWSFIADRFQSDTLFTADAETMLAMLNIFQPAGQERFASALSIQSGLNSPEWIADANKLDGVTSVSFTASDENYPMYLGTNGEDFFTNAADIAAVNAAYSEAGKSYFYWFNAPFDVENEENDENKSNQIHGFDGFSGIAAVYPNPFSSELIFRLNTEAPEYKELRIELFDLLGRRVKSERFGAGSIFTIDGLQLPKGMLTYTIFLDGAPVQNGKVVRVK